jgi:hypothetical protein
LNRALVASDQLVQICYLHSNGIYQAVYSGVLKAVSYSMTKLVCTVYNEVYERLQRRVYSGTHSGVAANTIIEDITGASGGGSLTDTFGKSDLGDDNGCAVGYGVLSASKYQMINVSGSSITKAAMSIRVNSGTIHAKIAVYSDNGANAPSTFLGSSDEVAVSNISFELVEFPFSTPVAVDANAYYWLAMITDGTVFHTSLWVPPRDQEVHKAGNANYGDGFPSSFPTISWVYSDYVDVYATIEWSTGSPTCPATPISVTYNNKNSFDACVNVAQILNKDYWADTLFNIGVRNTCKLALTFDEGLGQTATDLSGNGNHGTIYPTPVAFTFGRTGTGSHDEAGSANYKYASTWTSGATGTLSSITCRLKRNSTSGKGRAALYADNSGSPGALIAQTNEATIGTSMGWVTFTFATPPSVTNGTAYWLAVMTDEACTLRTEVPDYTFGRTTIGNDYYSFDALKMVQYTSGSAGTLTSISLYITGGSAGRYAKVAIYSDNADTPNALLAESASEEITSDGWHTFTGFSLAINASTKYWLACCNNGSYLLWWGNGGGNLYAAQGGISYPTFPNPFGGFVDPGLYQTSIYATVSGGGSGSVKYKADTYSDGFADPFGSSPSTIASHELCIYASGTTPGAFWVAGKYGYGLQLNGTTDYVFVADDASLQTTDLTICAWIYRTASGNTQIIANKGDWWGPFLFWIENNDLLNIRIGTDASHYVTTDANSVFPVNQWVFVVAVIESGKSIHLYQNAVLMKVYTTSQTMGSTSGLNLTIGRMTPGNYYFGGKIDEFMLFNSALTAEEISFIYTCKEHGCKRGLDRSKKRTKVIVQGVDAYGNVIAATSGTGEDTTVFTAIQPTDQSTLELYAEKKLEELNTSNTGTPIILPISVAAFLKPGDCLPLHIPQLAMDSVFRIQRITKASTKARVEVEKSVVLYQKALKNLSDASLQQLSARAGVTVTRSSTAPVSPSPLAGDLWYDTLGNVQKVFDGANWKTVTWS